MGLYRSKNISSAKRTADKWFNKWVRIRDTNMDGMVECITCGTTYEYGKKKVDAGHFIDSAILATRYDEENVHAQCKGCNNTANGKQYQHGKQIDLLHGPGTADALVERGKAGKRYSKKELMALAREYKARYEKLVELKSLNVN